MSFFDAGPLLFFGKFSKLSVSELESALGDVPTAAEPQRPLGVIAAAMDDLLDEDDGVGVRSLLAEAILAGDGVYDARSALSVPSLIPSLVEASLCAAGLIPATRSVRLPLGVLMAWRALSIAFPFLSR